MRGKYWIIGYLLIVCTVLGMFGRWVYEIDPYMHFHKPDIDKYFYMLNNQRSQNNGITRHFDYDALITGTSMTENFKTSEMDALFGCNSIKVCFSGASYKEVNDNIKIAAENNPNLRMVVRGLDTGMFITDKDYMSRELGTYPTYLYDNNPVNDVQYIFNRDVIWKRTYPMAVADKTKGFKPGITSFDDYSRWQYHYTFGINTVCPDGIEEVVEGKAVHLTDSERETIKGNIEQNVTSLAKENPDITFYYFFTPYSVLRWIDWIRAGTFYKQIEAEEYVIQLIMKCKNIKLFSFNNRMDIVTDLNNYKDTGHYGQWINSLILRWMHDGKYLLTKDNYKEYLNEELSNYLNMDYYELNGQHDYENDFYAAALLNEELTGAAPIKLDLSADNMHLESATIVENLYNGSTGIECTGSLKRESGSTPSIFDYLSNYEYVGARVDAVPVDDHGYLVFYGKKMADHGQPTVYVLNDVGEKVGEVTEKYQNIDNEWHQYIIDIANVTGNISIIFNGGYLDNTGSSDSKYVFSDITLY